MAAVSVCVVILASKPSHPTVVQVALRMAGLLTRGSQPASVLPGQIAQWLVGGRSPLTVAGAVEAKVPQLGPPSLIPDYIPCALHIGIPYSPICLLIARPVKDKPGVAQRIYDLRGYSAGYSGQRFETQGAKGSRIR